jgi:hypothetical protein
MSTRSARRTRRHRESRRRNRYFFSLAMLFMYSPEELRCTSRPIQPRSSATFVCPNCHMPVDSTKPDAMLSAVTQQWQHKDCWTRSLKRKAIVIDPGATQRKREG